MPSSEKVECHLLVNGVQKTMCEQSAKLSENSCNCIVYVMIWFVPLYSWQPASYFQHHVHVQATNREKFRMT